MQTVLMPKVANNKTWRAFPGTAYEVTLATQVTGNNLLVANLIMLAGAEPPRHVHEKEDEIFILQEGSMQVFRGDEIFMAHAGDSVWLPRLVPHHYSLLTPEIKAIFIATPGNIQGFFDTISQQVDKGFMPPVEAPDPQAMGFMIDLMLQYGIRFL